MIFAKLFQAPHKRLSVQLPAVTMSEISEIKNPHLLRNAAQWWSTPFEQSE